MALKKTEKKIAASARRKPPKPDRVTLKAIAGALGMSTMSVSQALNGGESSSRVSPETRERIQALAKEWGYRPHAGARAMRRGSFKLISLVLPIQLRNAYMDHALLIGMLDTLAAADYDLILTRVPAATLTRDDYIPKLFRELMVDGLIIDYAFNIPAGLAEMLEARSLPAVYVNSKREFDSVRPDDYRAALEVTERLLALGHREIPYIGFEGEHYSIEDRFLGYQHAMRKHGAGKQVRRVIAPLADVGMHEFASGWLKANRASASAVVTYSPAVASPLVYAAIEQRMRVPEDLSVVTFGESKWSNFGWEGTMMEAETYEVGAAAARMLLSKIANPSLHAASIAIPFHAIEGCSVRQRSE